ASPWPDLAGWLELEPQARAVASGAALRGCRPGVDLRPLPLDRRGAPASPAGPRVRPAPVLRPGPLRRGRAPAVLLPGSRHGRCPHPGERGLRLATLRQSLLVHGLRGAGGLRVLER